MNKIRTTERFSGVLAFAFSALFYIAVAALIVFLMQNRPSQPAAFSPAPVNLSFAQIELQAAAEPPPVVEPEPEPPPSEKVDVVTEEIVVQPEPPPPEPQRIIEAPAQVTQKASAPAVPPVDRKVLLGWVREQIDKEKYYPPAARNAGLEGQYRLLVKIGSDGKISEAVVLNGEGHPMLRRSLEKIMSGLVGRGFGQTLPDPVELPFDFEFRLN